MTTLNATVKEVENCSMLVCNNNTSEEIVVHAQNACRFCPGDRVCIRFNGVIATSNPPQITAISVVKLPSCGCR